MSKPKETKDMALELTIRCIARQLGESNAESILWVADEHPITAHDLAALRDSSIYFVSNRIDQFRLAEQFGLRAHFSDFSFRDFEDLKIQHVFFRAAKERALVHHVINQAFNLLPVMGTLRLAGYKHEGIKTHISRASELFGSKAKVSKGKNQLSTAVITKSAAQNPALDDRQYTDLREIVCKDNQRFWSKPGMYGWDKIDRGSLFLTETLCEQISSLENQQTLDLGCGYGYLSRQLARLKPNRVVATDNCAAAIRATAKNLQEFEATNSVEVIATDAGDSIEGSFDFIICNPPFHQGFSTNASLHRKFLENTKRLLKPSGQAWYVVNQFLALEKECEKLSLQHKEITRNSRFKVLLVRK